jgi:benzoate membrane transport protein
VTAGALYILFGFTAGAVTAFVSASPPILVEAVAGLAFLGAFRAAIIGAVSVPEDRETAVIAFLVTCPG